MAIFGLFWSKMKKTRMDSDRKWKVCLMKLPLFLLKNALGTRYKRFYIFFVIPLPGHFRHASPGPILISLFCFFFTDYQQHFYLIVRELISKENFCLTRLNSHHNSKWISDLIFWNIIFFGVGAFICIVTAGQMSPGQMSTRTSEYYYTSWGWPVPSSAQLKLDTNQPGFS